MPQILHMTAQELIRRLRKLARKQGKIFRMDSARGKGDHAKVFLDANSSLLPGKRGELPTGTFKSICKDLGIKPEDL